MELGAPVTTSIALHHFTAWANYKEVHLQSCPMHAESQLLFHVCVIYRRQERTNRLSGCVAGVAPAHARVP